MRASIPEGTGVQRPILRAAFPDIHDNVELKKNVRFNTQGDDDETSPDFKPIKSQKTSSRYQKM
jgi:hypothetical protein